MSDSLEPKPIIPPGYVPSGDLFGNLEGLSGWRWLLFANLLALIPLSVAILLLWLPYQFYSALGAPLVLPEPGWPSWVSGLMGVLIIAGSIFLHETLHGLALRLLGYHPRLMYARGYLLASIPGFITRRDYLIMILTPITVLSLGGALLLLWLPVSLGQWLVAALLLNAAASVGDLVVASRVFRFPHDALFADRDGIHIFLPDIDRKP
jgi:hypothetical protein